MTQTLSIGDFILHITLCQVSDYYIIVYLADEENLEVLIMSDEATLNHQVKVNKQNVRYWSAENPKEIYDYPLPAGKVTVWDHLAFLRTMREGLSL